jgi:hypothetical protein
MLAPVVVRVTVLPAAKAVGSGSVIATPAAALRNTSRDMGIGAVFSRGVVHAVQPLDRAGAQDEKGDRAQDGHQPAHAASVRTRLIRVNCAL